MDQIGIETSRHVRLTYKPAPLIYRIVAWLYDVFLYVIYIMVFMWSWGGIVPSDIVESLNINWIVTLAIFLPYFIYFPLIETLWNGRTVGKKIMGIRVTRIDGTRASLGSYLIRWLFRFIEISATGGVVAILTILINGRGQRLGDIVAGTCVVNERDDQLSHRQLFNHTELDRDVVYEGAAELEDKDINVIKNLLNARQTYSPDAHRKLMARTRSAIEQKTGAEDSSISDEAYLETVIKDYNTIYGSTSD
ncbi:RDD family protein [Rhodohalobacter sp. 8-1]|uniref:RDD family protein n=1 Tax=Rhodohalobacter sp. 8-1 TaxID=3131972 RepID=UPI0030EEA69F